MKRVVLKSVSKKSIRVRADFHKPTSEHKTARDYKRTKKFQKPLDSGE